MRHLPASLGVAALALATTFAPKAAHAVGEDEASGNLKGTIGCGLLGAELVLSVEAAIGVKEPWAYVGGGVAGAAGGAVAGYFIEQDASARVSMLLLAGGLTLAIPTTVAVLSATAYEPPADYLEDTPPADEPVADPPAPASPAATPPAPTPAPSGAVEKRQRRARVAGRVAPLRLTPPALFDISPKLVALSVPAVEIRDAYTKRELAMFGVEQATELRVPVLNVAF